MDPTCAFCGLRPGTKRCARCKQQHYCSANCQKQAWSTHKRECIACDSPTTKSPVPRPPSDNGAQLPGGGGGGELGELANMLGGGGAGAGGDLTSLMSSMNMDPSQLGEMMKSMQHMLPPELQKKAEKLSVDDLTNKMRLHGQGPSAAEVAYGGVDAAGAAANHTRSGPPVAQPATATRSACAALRAARAATVRVEDEAASARRAATAAVRAIAPKARVSKMRTIGGRLVVVLDEAVDGDEVERLHFALEHRAAFRKSERSQTDRPDQRHGVTEHDAEAFCATPLYERIASLTALFWSDETLTPNRIYTVRLLILSYSFRHLP